MKTSSQTHGSIRQRAGSVGLVLALTLPWGGAGAAAPGLSALEAAARKEGALTYYSAQTAAVNDTLVKAMKERFGIAVTIYNAPTTALKIRAQTEIDAGKLQADMIGLGEHMIYNLNEKAFASIADLPRYAGFPEKFKAPKYVVTSIQPAVLVVNTNKVKKGEITKWTDMANPKWKGQIAMLGINSSISISSMYVDLAKKHGDDFMRRLAALRPNFQSSSAPTVQLVAAGEAALSLPISVSVLPALEKAGAPIATVDAGPVTGAQITNGISASATRPNAARLMLNFMMSPEGQAIQNGNRLGGSPLPNIAGTYPVPKDYTPPNEAVSRQEIARVRELLGSP